MDDPERYWEKALAAGVYGPVIDRCFRTVEMIGITALLGTVLRDAHPRGAQFAFFMGTFAAILYLIDPVHNAIRIALIRRTSIGRWWILAPLAITLLTVAASAAVVPTVQELSLLIAKTIKG